MLKRSVLNWCTGRPLAGIPGRVEIIVGSASDRGSHGKNSIGDTSGKVNAARFANRAGSLIERVEPLPYSRNRLKEEDE